MLIISLFFAYLAIHELLKHHIPRKGYDSPDSSPISKGFIAFTLSLALACGWKPLRITLLEHKAEKIATQLADGRKASFHCNSFVDALYDNDTFAAGHASPETGRIVFQIPWCDRLLDYLDHPAKANREELHSLNMLTHESMHVRGEMNEATTECQGIQRNYRTAKLLGISDNIAKRNALNIYNINYQYLKYAPQRVANYYSDQCAPNMELDEHLPDSTWINILN